MDHVLCLSLLCCLVCSLQPCVHLLGKGWLLGSLVCSCIFVTFPYGVQGQVWYLIVLIPDLCLLVYLTAPINYYGHVETVTQPSHSFSGQA